MSDQPERIVLARTTDVDVELVLARRGEVLELVVDGVFAMDSLDPAGERELATAALDLLTRPEHPADVLVGGLGLGFTARALLDDSRAGTVEVVELHAALVGWARAGLLPALPTDDPRLTLTVGDVADVVPTRRDLDAVLLDVDNGPDFLVHTRNAPLYTPPFLAAAGGAVRPGGVVAVWSSHDAPRLAAALATTVGPVHTLARTESTDRPSWVYLAVRPA